MKKVAFASGGLFLILLGISLSVPAFGWLLPVLVPFGTPYFDCAYLGFHYCQSGVFLAGTAFYFLCMPWRKSGMDIGKNTRKNISNLFSVINFCHRMDFIFSERNREWRILSDY